MSNRLRLIMAQLNFLVGDIEGNTTKILAAIQAAKETYTADLIIFPELALSGYPPEDLLYRNELFERIAKVLPEIQAASHDIDVILGYPEKRDGACYNQAALWRNGQLVAHYHKQKLPNYSVFDEVRYFKPGITPCIVDIKGIPVAITICEDLWFPEPMTQAKEENAQLAISINASPFAKDKAQTRTQIMGQRAREGQMPIVYVNLVGAQDELVFDGGSMVLDATGQIVQQAEFFVEGLFPVDLAWGPDQVEITSLAATLITDVSCHIASPPKIPPPAASLCQRGVSEEARVYQALVLGVHDYLEKNHFPSAIIGLSGGIDSALTLAIAVDAIGPERVEAVLMPSRYTAEMSIEDAMEQTKLMGVKQHILSIEPIFKVFLEVLAEEFAGLPADVTEENLQSRCRGTLLMALSNKKKSLVLTTGNKSEMSVGYATLYGDMVGGFGVLKDIPKTLVYRLAVYRNQLSPGDSTTSD